MGPSISFIIPTLGRRSLKRAIESIAQDRGKRDEVIVVGDGPQFTAKAIAESFSPRVIYMETGPTRAWGHAQRNRGMAAAKCDYLAFMDDDDYYLPGGISVMRRVLREHPGRPCLFKYSLGNHSKWKKKEVFFGNVGTLMFVTPNIKERLGVWRSNDEKPLGRGGDCLFIEDTLSRWPADSLMWREEVISRSPQNGMGRA